MESVRIAVIGGTGLYDTGERGTVEERDIPTPFGMPSDAVSIVEIGGQAVAFLPRHGKGHRLLPSEVPSRANIWALKSLGVEQILSISAVGSLADDLPPGSFVLVDQLIDRTTGRGAGRNASFFGDGVVGHVSFAEPFCPDMRQRIARALANARGGAAHVVRDRGTLVVMEGPPFSTRAESLLHRSWGAHLIGMTALPEARLAREAEICYALLAMVTDWDCWRESGEGVTLDAVLATMRDNSRDVRAALPRIVAALADHGDCPCRHAAAQAITTDPSLIPWETRRRLQMLYGRYWTRSP